MSASQSLTGIFFFTGEFRRITSSGGVAFEYFLVGHKEDGTGKITKKITKKVDFLEPYQSCSAGNEKLSVVEAIECVWPAPRISGTVFMR